MFIRMPVSYPLDCSKSSKFVSLFSFFSIVKNNFYPSVKIFSLFIIAIFIYVPNNCNSCFITATCNSGISGLIFTITFSLETWSSFLFFHMSTNLQWPGHCSCCIVKIMSSFISFNFIIQINVEMMTKVEIHSLNLLIIDSGTNHQRIKYLLQ